MVKSSCLLSSRVAMLRGFESHPFRQMIQMKGKLTMKVLGYTYDKTSHGDVQKLEDLVRQYNAFNEAKGFTSRIVYKKTGATYTCWLASTAQLQYGTHECELVSGTLPEVCAVVSAMSLILEYERHRMPR